MNASAEKSGAERMSADSENVFHKSGRGRPRKYSKDFENDFRKQMEIPPFASNRTFRNHLQYVGAAAHLLDSPNKDRYQWLLRGEFPRQTILSYLGVIESPTLLEVFANQLCEIQPTARKARSLIAMWQVKVAYLLRSEHDSDKEQTLTDIAQRAISATFKTLASRPDPAENRGHAKGRE